ncbi:plasmid stabilization protein [Sphingomonas sp. Leaf357]|uniref:type II toxin-antitoxin system RelE/ParE family toxin n=1 Tax=Sphingomonas sp. Leaf357 TaxID=1736350 RepID=UPI0006F1F2F1|nr:type II toxin-antitoxin system RelE/ParE family toxin [Sphingomonas sp. Leaf357]KQS02088.1 plasmid stabilization protein [Sphingomonas sp. Leaf357]
MTSKPLVLRVVAEEDIEAAAAYYTDTAGEPVAIRFAEALDAVFGLIASRPAIGSSRLAHDLRIAGLRSRKLKRFPYLVVYIERDHHIDIWRVIHVQRDIPGWLREDD